MASILPHAAHGDTLAAVDIRVKYEGSGPARHVVGTQIDCLLTFDRCARVPITILGLDASTLPGSELVDERNQNLQFLLVRFQNLVITFSGGDYGSIRYKGTATAVEFLNLTPPPTQPRTVPGK